MNKLQNETLLLKNNSMRNYNDIRKTCKHNKPINARVIDEFLIYLAAGRKNKNAEKVMEKRFDAFRHITKEFDIEWVNRLKAQYLAHLIFKEGGDLKALLGHPLIKRLSKDDISHLEVLSETPWRFSFSRQIDNPAEDFYLMFDVLTFEQYLLYSPGITRVNQEQNTSLFLNLIGFNGDCWETYGPIVAYKSFNLYDILFFGSQLNPDIEDEEDLIESIENNPVPYMMLLSGANYPYTFNKNDLIIYGFSEYDIDSIDSEKLKKDFKSEYAEGVYRFTLKYWGGNPHFAQAFYDENEQIILLTASTLRGFEALVNKLNSYGYSFDPMPFLMTCPVMLITAKEILNREIVLNEYDRLFEIETSKDDQDQMDKMNAFMGMIIPDLNSGSQPDIKTYAKRSGLDPETALDLYKHIKDSFKKKGM